MAPTTPTSRHDLDSSWRFEAKLSRGVEEVLRAEVRQRMEGEAKIETRVEEVVQALSNALEQVRSEAEDDGARLAARLDAVEDGWPAKVVELKKQKASKDEIQPALNEMLRLKDVCGEVPPPKKKNKTIINQPL